MVPVGLYLQRTGQFRVTSVDYGLPPRKSNADMRISVKYLAEGVDRILTKMSNEGVKVSRVDIVAHSMGGLISRLYIVGDGQSVPAHPDKVRKLVTLGTPHGGSSVADWYTDLMDNGSVDCHDPSGYVPEKVTRGEMEWLISIVRWFKKLGPDALEFGEAVRQLQTKGHPGSIVDVITARQSQVNDKTSYHIIAGNSAFIRRGTSKAVSAILRAAYKGYSGPFGAEWRPAVEAMINSFLDLVSQENSDGVVMRDSALAKGTGITPVTIDFAPGSNHFEIPSNGRVLLTILRILTYGQVWPPGGTLVISHSPGHLHVYDASGRHVGLGPAGQPEIGIEEAVYEPFSDAAGDHELIWVPQDKGITVEFQADEEGQAGIDISQNQADGVHWFSYEDIEVKPGSEILIQLASLGPKGSLKHPGEDSVVISPAHSDFIPVSQQPGSALVSPETPSRGPTLEASGSAGSSQPVTGFEPLWSLLLLAICGLVLSAGGVVAMLFLARKHRFAKWGLVVLIPVTLLLVGVSCLLGWAAMSGHQGGPSTSGQPTPFAPLATGVVQFTPVPTFQAPPISTSPVPAIPTPTSLPELVATPSSPAVPFIGPITFAEGVTEDGEPINPATSFPEGITKVSALVEYGNMNPEIEFATQWVFNGEVVLEDSGPWTEGEQGVYWEELYLQGGVPLPAGTYEYRFYISGDLVQKATFTIKPASP